jgi:hypothetical protein
MPDIQFRAYLTDAVVDGRVVLPDGVRLTDHLNESEDLALTGAVLTALDDGRVISAGDVAVPVTEIHMVGAFDSGGEQARRIRTRSTEVEMVLGPYLLTGYIHAPTGGDPVSALSRRAAMVPVTGAKIAFHLAGEVQVDEMAVAIANRLLADVALPEPGVPSILEKLGLSAVDPRARDLTGEITVNPHEGGKPGSAP